MSTKIEWTRGDDGTPGKTWNPTTGCDRVSPGCDHCYALTMAARLKGMGQAKYQRDGDPRTSGPGFGLTVHPDTLALPLRWQKPRRVFVNSMSDLWHTDVPDEFIARFWVVMALTPEHTYQILTKRHARMRSLLASGERWTSLLAEAFDYVTDNLEAPMPPDRWTWAKTWVYGWERLVDQPRDPLLNVWLGVSVEDQERARLRIPALVKTPAAVRFLSCEPLLGPVDLQLTGSAPSLLRAGETATWRRPISWVIVGGESGRGARPMDLGWVRSLVEQCRDAGTACFVKQLGSVWAREHSTGGKGGDPEQWPAELRIRQFPVVAR